MSSFIEVKDVSKRYDGREVLSIDRLSLERGNITSVVGPNGSGKTVLLRLLAMLDRPSGGSIYMNGQKLNGANRELRNNITMVQQSPYMFDGTIAWNVGFGLRARSFSSEDRTNRIAIALKMMGLGELAGRKTSQLSAGEMQRVGLARSLAIRPELLLLDEPTANVDKAHIGSVEKAVEWARKECGSTVVLATHDADLGLRLSDDVVSLVDGRLTDMSMRNHFSGEVVKAGSGRVVEICQDVKVSVETEKLGKIHIVIDPQEVIISLEKLDSSARNVLKGAVAGLNREGDCVRITVDVGVGFDSIITLQSLEEMKLELGMKVFVAFKASSVRVL